MIDFPILLRMLAPSYEHHPCHIRYILRRHHTPYILLTRYIDLLLVKIPLPRSISHRSGYRISLPNEKLFICGYVFADDF